MLPQFCLFLHPPICTGQWGPDIGMGLKYEVNEHVVSYGGVSPGRGSV